MALSDLQGLVTAKVRDTGGRISPAEQDAAIAGAVARYSADRPRRVVEDRVSDGTNILALPAGWVEGLSAVEQMEAPPDAVPPALIERWQMVQRPTGLVILLPDPPTAGAVVRVLFTAAHQVDDTLDTVPVLDRDAVASLAAAELLDQLASAFAGDRDTVVVSADSVNQGTRSRDFARQADSFRKRYAEHLGIGGQRAAAGSVAASATVVLPSGDASGRQYFSHRRF